MAKKATKKASKKTGKSTKKTDNPKVIIRDEFRKLLTPLTTEEYKALEESIVRDGVREPLVVWKEKGILVDGHNRRDICKDNGKKYRIIEKSFANEAEVKLWIWDNQESRRNMTPFRRVEVVLNLKDIIAEQAKQNQRKRNRRKSGEEGCPKLDKAKGKQVHTDKVLAKRAGVSRNTFRNAEAIVKMMVAGKIDKKDIAGLYSGKKKINGIYLKYCVKKSGTKKPSQDLSGRIETTFSTLEKQFAHIDRTDFYNQIIEWAKAQKAGAGKQSE